MARENWGSRIGLVLAMAGNAVGLGNFLRFPVQAVQNGGGAFMIPYLVCFVLLGVPMLWLEWATGRFAGARGNHSTPFILQSLDEKRAIWKYVGVLGLFINLAVAAYYIYVESWTLSYAFSSLFGTFHGLQPDKISAFFDNYTGHLISFMGIPVSVWMWLICLLLNLWILNKGLKNGIETVAKIAMPLLILFGVLLAIKGVSLRAGGESGAVYNGVYGLNFLWTPNFSSIWSPKVWLAAAGQIFFTLSVGMGAIQCYASYIRENEDIALNAMAAGWLNEFVEVVIGGAIIIPISIGYLGIDGVKSVILNSGGMGLGFRTLPALFTNWGAILGSLAGLMWFSLLFFAGITSSLAMGMPVLSFFEDEFEFSRKKATALFGGIVFLMGLPCVALFKYGVFDEFDFWAGTVALVVFAIAETILFGWFFGINKGWEEVNRAGDITAPIIFKFITQFITPTLLIFVLIASLIQPENQEGKIISHTSIQRKDTLFWKDTIKGKVVIKSRAFKNDTLIQRDTLHNINDWAAAFDSIRQGKLWALDRNSMLATIYHQGIRKDIAQMEDSLTGYYKKRNLPEVHQKIEAAHKKIQFLRSKRRYMNASRMLLITLLAAIALMVHQASKRRKQKKTLAQNE
jgi:neurotransmitter:Na+ symporter, NSS family